LVGGEYSQKMDHKKGFWKSCYYVTNPLFYGFCIKNKVLEQILSHFDTIFSNFFCQTLPLSYTVCTVLSTKVVTINITSSAWDDTQWSYIKIINQQPLKNKVKENQPTQRKKIVTFFVQFILHLLLEMIANDSTLKKWRKNHWKSKSRNTNQPPPKKNKTKQKLLHFVYNFAGFKEKCFFSWTCLSWSCKAHTKLYFPILPNLCSKQSFQSSWKLTQWPRSFTSFMCL
jgi:hypothetical protein